MKLKITKYFIYIISTALIFSLFGCLQWDFWEKKLPNGYYLSWVNLPINRDISKGQGRLIGNYIFEIGYNDNFIIAKQHPMIGQVGLEKVDTSKINYYLIKFKETKSDDDQIIGPMTREVFLDVLENLKIEELSFDIKYNVESDIGGRIYTSPKSKKETEFDTIFRKLKDSNLP
jgi:hypothetical protein